MSAPDGGTPPRPDGAAPAVPHAEPAPGPPLKRKKRNRRRDTVQFVVLFVVYILAALTGYRAAVNTEPNMWYLYFVAKHTSAILDVVGHDSTMRQPTFLKNSPAAARTQLDRWRHGEAEQGAVQAVAHTESVDTSPLKPWEQWLYFAYDQLHRGQSLQDQGPMVIFTFRQGLSPQIQDLRLRQAEILRDESMSDASRKSAMERLTAELQALQEENRALPDGPESLHKRVGDVFSFRLVPDCGAIPLMAIYVAAVLAFPCAIRHRIVGIALGVPFLYVVNLGRLTTLAVIGAIDHTEGNQWFDFFHEFVWQGIFIIFVVAVWMVWIEFLVHRRAST